LRDLRTPYRLRLASCWQQLQTLDTSILPVSLDNDMGEMRVVAAGGRVIMQKKNTNITATKKKPI
jgi:hypothetical protein